MIEVEKLTQRKVAEMLGENPTSMDIQTGRVADIN
jgi:hypothetical protein